jgi:murein DD-endopeptidase MepM/ murein hydrolase activator NlpD
LSLNESLNPFLDDVFSPRLDRESIDANKVRYEIIQNGSMERFRTDYLDGATIFKGIVLHVYSPGEDDGWVNLEGSSQRDGRRRLTRMRVRIPELHAHIPEPCAVGTDDKTNRTRIEMHPLFISSIEYAGPAPSVGDFVRVSFTKGPKYGIQAGGIFHDVYMKRLAQGSSNVCEALVSKFSGVRNIQRLGNTYPDPPSSHGQHPEHDEVEPGSLESQAARRQQFIDENPQRAQEIADIFKYGPTQSPGRVSSEIGQRTARCVEPRNWENLPAATRGECRQYSSSDHQGLDVALSVGTPVRSPFAGQVLETGSNEARGQYVVLVHRDANGGVLYTVRYYHLDGIAVNQGDSVNPGDHIGNSGATGRVTGPHLHLEVRDRTGSSLNPRDYFPVGSFTNASSRAGN